MSSPGRLPEGTRERLRYLTGSLERLRDMIRENPETRNVVCQNLPEIIQAIDNLTPRGNVALIGNEGAGGVSEDVARGSSIIKLAERLEKIITPEAYQEMLAKCQSPEEAETAAGTGDHGVSYLFQDLQPKGSPLNDNLLENYLLWKKKGKDKMKSAISLIPGEVDEARASCYFLKMDRNLIERIARTFGLDALVKAALRIKIPSGSDNSSGASTSASGQARSSINFRHHPYRRTEVNERSNETVYLIEPDGGVPRPGKKISELLDPSSPGVKLENIRSASDHHLLAEFTKRAYYPNDSGNVHFYLNVSIESTNMPKPIEKVQLGAQQILQDMYELEDSSKEVTIVASNGAGIKCHRNILMAQIPSFRTMLSPDRGMNEAQTGRIELNENSEDGLREFIRFLYGFELNLKGITSDMALELFQLGNKYQVKKLDDTMKNFLCEKKINFYTVDSILELYFTVRNVDCLEELKAHAMTEMSKLSKEVLKGSEYFKTLCSEDQVDLGFILMEWNRNC